MKTYHIIQLNSTKYVILDEDFKRLNKDGREPVRTADKNRTIMSLGQAIIFIKKNKGHYNSYIPFEIPQLKQSITESSIAKEVQEINQGEKLKE